MERGEQGGLITLETQRDCEVFYEACKVGFSDREKLLRFHRPTPDSELPTQVSGMLAQPLAWGLAQIATRRAVSRILQPDEAELYLREVFNTSSEEQMAPALPYAD